jgi:peroxiredoxin Q/BCP
MRVCRWLLLCAVACLAFQMGPDLKPGDTAPDLSLASSAGGGVKLSDFRGKQGVVLAFIIKAFTIGSTQEMQAYQSALQKFTDAGYQVLGIGTDDADTMKRWAAEMKLTFPLLSDADGKTAQAYGVLMKTRKLAFRTTFAIGRDGRIVYVERGGSAMDPNGAAAACSQHPQGAAPAPKPR